MLNRILDPSVSHVADGFLSHSFGGSHPVQPSEMKTELLDALGNIKQPLRPRDRIIEPYHIWIPLRLQ